MLEIIPVLDLMNSVAVSGKSGNRETYTPLKTIYASSSDPVEIANSLKKIDEKSHITQWGEFQANFIPIEAQVKPL